ncbi:HNH endonuclease [Arthrobacter sp. SA17]
MGHIIPVIRGGSHRITNLQASHLGCNISKGDRTL